MNQTFIQQDPGIERRRKLAEAMLANGETGPVRTGMEGLARVAKQLMGGYQTGKAERDQKEYLRSGNQDLARIMSDMSQDVKPLSQHPATKDIATSMQLQQMQSDNAARSAERSRLQGLEDYKTKKGIDHDYRTNKSSKEGLIAQDSGYTPGTPEYNAFVKRLATQSKNKVVVENNFGGDLSKGEIKADQDFGSEYQSWVSGGFADATKSINQLTEVSEALGKPGANLTGPTLGAVPDFIKKYSNPESIAVREEIEEIVQRNLRLVLGAQFTEKEGDRLIKRAFNPDLSEQENKKRVDRLLQQIKTAAQAKNEAAMYFRNNGTLKGWDGALPTISDFREAPTEGARLSPDGNYYIKKADGWYRVDE